MSPPLVTPDAICMEIQPGEARAATISVTKIPTPSGVTVTLTGGGNLVSVTDVSVFEEIHRALTEEEILELPPRPPSIRENARRNGVTERNLVDHGVASPFVVAQDQTVDITLQFSVALQTLEGITVGRLVVSGSDFAPLEVPVLCVVGRAVATPTIDQANVGCALAPGETAQRSVSIAKAPIGAQVVACVANGRGLIRLKTLIALREERRPATDEEIAELPPFPPSIRENARRNGFIEYVETGRSDGLTPLAVAAGHSVLANLEFSAPATGSAPIIEAALILASPQWQRLEIPLTLIVGSISVELLNSAVSVTQGRGVDLVVTVISLSGPGDTVHFSIVDGDRLSVSPDSLMIQPGKSTVGTLTLFAAPDAPIGVLSAVFVASVFEQMQTHIVPLRIEIEAGGITVSTRPFTLTARQGDTVPFDVTIFTEGITRTVVITPGELPSGVRMDSATVAIGPPGGVHIQPMHLFIDRDAPTTDRAWTPINWSANNGLHSGLVNLPLTIELQPDSRTFHKDFVTPPGTALGGSAELVINNEGHIIFRGHMHGSGFDPYAFRIGYFLRGSNIALALTDVISDRVGGTLGGGDRERPWSRETDSPYLKKYWREFRDSNAEFLLTYDDTGVIGTLQGLVAPLTEFLLVRVLAGPWTAAILVLGPELARITDLPVTSPNGIRGAIILGGVVFLFGPLGVVPAVVAGVAIAAAGDVKSRPMHQTEITEAARVFGDTLPIDRIRVTNLQSRAALSVAPNDFATVNVDDNMIIIGMGDRFDQDLVGDPTFIHELTHAWQFAHRPISVDDVIGVMERPFFSPEQNEALYKFTMDGRPWSGFGIEAQAMVVQTWYDSFKNLGLTSELAQTSPFFPCIARNIRLGQP
jgi:hypothetical protein